MTGAQRSKLAVTWWGHASATIHVGGLAILTDPVLGGRIGHLLRPAATVPPPEAATADLVLISHLHADHCDKPSLRRLPPGTVVVGPVNLGRVLGDIADRLQLIELRPGDKARHGQVDIAATRAFHDARRLPGSSISGPPLGFVLTVDGTRIWYPGDTGRFPGLGHDVAPVDLALVPIGGWGPSLGDEHLDPEQAADVAADARAARVIPVHYGTYWPAGLDRLMPRSHLFWYVSPPERFRAAMAQRCPQSDLRILEHGESVEWRDAG